MSSQADSNATGMVAGTSTRTSPIDQPTSVSTTEVGPSNRTHLPQATPSDSTTNLEVYPPEISPTLADESNPEYPIHVMDVFRSKLDGAAITVEKTEPKIANLSVQVDRETKKMDELFDMKSVVPESNHRLTGLEEAIDDFSSRLPQLPLSWVFSRTLPLRTSTGFSSV